jgi:TolA-binding protein
LGLVLLALGGCAYYNTFYLAKRYYGDAQRAQERAATDSPTPDAVSKYDATIRQCNKVLTDYPKSKWADDAWYLLGVSFYGKGDYPEALRRLREFRERHPESPFVPDVRFTEGLAHYRQREYPRADSVFREVDAAYPRFKRRWALFYYAGETQAGLKHWDDAVGWYRRAFEAGERRRDRGLALTRMGDALAAAERYDSAAAVFGQAMRVEERAKQRFEIALRRGDALKRSRRYQDAFEHYRDLRPLAPAERREAELDLRINECLGLLGRHEEALAGYRDIVTRHPQTAVASEAQFQIGYLYETALADLDAAGREYDRLKSDPPSTFVDQAARRARNLASLREYREKAGSDTTQARSRAAFLLAELYYFQLEKSDSAFLQYELVEREFPQSPYAPKAGYARLWIMARDRGDTAAAAALTDSVVRRYRGSHHVESALYLWKNWSGRADARTALLDSLMVNPDTSTAALYREPEPEPEPEDTIRVAPGFTPEQKKAQLDSLETIRVRLLQEGKAPYRRRKLDRPGAFVNVPDSLISRPVPPRTSPPDSTAAGRSVPVDTVRTPSLPAPPDSTRLAPPAVADSAGARQPAPPDTSILRVVPSR